MATRVRSWHRVAGVCALEFYGDWKGNGFRYFWAKNDQPMPDEIGRVFQHALTRIEEKSDEPVESGEILIHFRSSGYYDPGRTYGPPEDCYPPEGDEERTLDRVEVSANDVKVSVTQGHAEIFFDACFEAVMEAELDCDQD